MAVQHKGKHGSDPRFSTNKSNLEDTSSPFFLHHSDNPGLVLVSQTLTRDNYASWSKSMLIALSVKNKLVLNLFSMMFCLFLSSSLT
ncbi:hypothetical protein ACOSQ2_005414 [Xanthoceras sorbifolium]